MARDTFLVLEDRVQLPRLYYTWHSVKAFHEDDATLDVLAYVLAGDKNSRLYKRLVYDMQVAQDVAAFQASGRRDGWFQVRVTLKRGQNSIRANFLDRLAADLGKADQLNFYNYFAGTPDYVRQDAARYDRVSAAAVQQAAQNYLGKPKVVLTVVPQGKTELMVRGAVP